MSQTGEHAAVELTEHSSVRTDWKTLGAVGVLLLAGAAGWFGLKARVDGNTERIAGHDTRIGRLEDAKASTDLHLQRIDDDMRALLQAVERIDKNVQELQRRH